MQIVNDKALRIAGFTLLEILIALFIFTILSLMLMRSLHQVIIVQAGTEANAARLREVQMAMLLMSRDVEQAVYRPITNAVGKELPAFSGTPQGFELTHLGMANPTGTIKQSSLQRTKYSWKHNTLQRQYWLAVDMTSGTKSFIKPILTTVSAVSFEYLDKENHFQSQWPIQGQGNQRLPRAVRVMVVIEGWGRLSQLFIIPVQPIKKLEAAAKNEGDNGVS